MYSVLIQNQRTMESFQRFHPLFLDALNNENISSCLWLEAGETIETAVPELYQLIDGKEEWRAVIVRMDGISDANHPTVQGNPYDYLENSSNESFIKESPIPIIRLSRMLGGVPTPPMKFEAQQVDDSLKATRIIYQPKVDKEDMSDYKELCEKYQFKGVSPTEIILVSPSYKHDDQSEDVKKAWKNNCEINSSEFWRRNGYPSSCRFTVYEMERQGERQKEADLFKAWMSVLLLATNEIDSSTLQAYRLHRLDVSFDKKLMSDVMQRTMSKAKNAKQYIKRSIQREMEEKLSQDAPLPDYELEAPVVLNLPRPDALAADEQNFGLTAKTGSTDLVKWAEMKNKAERSLDHAVVNAERALDHTADKIRSYCSYLPDEVRKLDNYQMEDFEKELDHTHETILSLRSELPKSSDTNKKTIAELDRNVKDKLFKRVTRSQAANCLLLFFATTVFSFISAGVYCAKYHWGSWGNLAYSVFACLLLLLVVEIVSLYVFQREIRKSIKAFNKFTNATVAQIADNGAKYSRYMSCIATHIHGSSYLSTLSKKVFQRDASEYYMRTHLAALDAFVLVLEDWCKSFHLAVDFKVEEMNEALIVDTETSPYVNPVYTFEDVGSYSAEVNCSGDYIDSPFSFVRNITIVREELYDGE